MQVVDGKFDARFYKKNKKTNQYTPEKNKNSIYVTSVIKDIDVFNCSSKGGKKQITISSETLSEILGTLE